jgi:sugar/nucleoside kinase (ribokinase family)
MRNGVLCVGTVAVDYTKTIDALPELESLVLIDAVTQSTGGPGLNIAFDLRQLDPALTVEAIGCIANDPAGDYILEQTNSAGIVNSRMQRAITQQTSFSDALTLTSNGKRTFLFHSGSNDELDLGLIDADLNHPKILHVGAAGLHKYADKSNQWVELLKRAQALGIHTNMEMVYLTPVRTRELVLPCLPHLTSLVINESEAAALLDTDLKVDSPNSHVDWETLEGAASSLISLGVNQLAVIHTPAGAVAADSRGNTWRQGSVKVPQDRIKGTTGAGDAFAAGVLAGLHAGWQIPECLTLGSAAAGLNIQSPSSSDGLATAADTLTSAGQYGYRRTTDNS